MIDIFHRLLDRYSNQNWWPADTKDEIVIGAVLTQNTAWRNVERAIENLKRSNLCSLDGINSADIDVLKENIKPAGFFNQKASYLKNIAAFFCQHGGFDGLNRLDTARLRKMLLSVKGIGKETADSILLYVFDRPIFVVDAYTKRLLKRHGIAHEAEYDQIQRIFMENLPCDVGLFKEYHALIVRNAKEFCKTRPDCSGCPLEGLL